MLCDVIEWPADDLRSESLYRGIEMSGRLRDRQLSDIATRHKLLDRGLHHDPVLRDIHRLYDILDGKGAALFSFVAIMIAACTFLAGNSGSMYLTIAFLVIVVAYVGIAITLLSGLNFNMYDIDINALRGFSDKHMSPDVYDAGTDEIFEETRKFFSRRARDRGVSHKRALNITRWLTKVFLFFVLLDIGYRIWILL